jgi:2-polyprenyl-3-methyl-5-hydroxy-6-metoxy-1,4-benzoquinol methylase
MFSQATGLCGPIVIVGSACDVPFKPCCRKRQVDFRMTTLVDALIARARRLVPSAGLITDDVSVAAGRLLTRIGTKLVMHPHRTERIDVPERIETDGKAVDIVEDLVEYTGLERRQVQSLIQRQHESFRAEWHAFPMPLRNEAWFYLSSRTYLFANAVHEAEGIADALTDLTPDSSDVLDFGGGTGNLALALAARGHHVDFVERSALQKDFVRFRVDKHRLKGNVRILDQWTPLKVAAYDLVCAFDVLEHVAELTETLRILVTAIRPGGRLAESSPFVRNVSNPMHHETEPEFLHLMEEYAFSPVLEAESFRLWRAEADDGDGGRRASTE